MKWKTILIISLSTVGIASVLNIVHKVYIDAQDNKKQDNIVSIADGVNEIKLLESKNVVELEKKIDNMRKKTLSERDFKSIFSNSVIMGDSISEGLTGYEILSKSSVVAVKGRNTSTAMKDIQTTINLQPANVFLTYGMNDLLYFNGDSEKFIKQYKKMINEIKNNLPQTSIYITGILPMQQKAINKYSAYGKFDEFNEALKKMCEIESITFIETKHLLKENSELYENDGIHMKMSFYPLWLNELSKVANL